MRSFFFLSQFQILLEISTIVWQNIFKITTWIVVWIHLCDIANISFTNNEHDASTNDRCVVVFSSNFEFRRNVQSKSRCLRSNCCSLRNEATRSIKFQTTMQNSDYDNHYFVWILEIETVEIATRQNQTSWTETSTSSFQNLRENELVEKRKQNDFESWFWIAKDANRCNVSSCFVVMLWKRMKLDEENELKVHERWYRIKTANCNEKKKITNIEIDRCFDLWKFCCFE